MNKELNEIEEQLFDLLESKSFEALSDEEKSFVLEHWSEEEYRLQHLVQYESAYLDEEYEVRPLNFPNRKEGVVIPLYQAVAAVAAAIAISFFIFRGDQVKHTVEISNPVAMKDTVYVNKHIVDTVVQYETQYVDRLIVKHEAKEKPVFRANLMTNTSPSLPALDPKELKNRGESMKNNKAAKLVENLFVMK